MCHEMASYDYICYDNAREAVTRKNQTAVTGMGKECLQEAFYESNVPFLKIKNSFESIPFLCLLTYWGSLTHKGYIPQ